MYKLIGLLFFSVFSVVTIAQKANPDNAFTQNKRISFNISLDYLSNAVSQGRADSMRTPYLTPQIECRLVSGWHASLYGSILAMPNSKRLDLITLDAGYSFSVGDLDADVYAEKYFYNGKSTNVMSAVQGSAYVSTSYDVGLLNVFFEPGLNIGSKPDLFFDAGISKDIGLSEFLVCNPSFQVSASTRNFYSSYFGFRRNKRASGLSWPSVSAEVEDASKMKVMSVELSLPFTYTKKDWSVACCPVYSIAQNAAVVKKVVQAGPAVAPITSSFKESIANLFFMNVTVSRQF